MSNHIDQLPDGVYGPKITTYHRSLRKDRVHDLDALLKENGEDAIEKWSADGCGIASTTICIDSLRRATSPTDRMPSVFKLCETHKPNAYIPGVGWKHKELADLANNYGLEAFNQAPATLEEVLEYLLDGWLAVISVTLFFKGGEAVQNDDGTTRTLGKGGHLVVAKGFRKTNGRVSHLEIVDCQNKHIFDGDMTSEDIEIEKVLNSYSNKAIFFRNK